MYRLALNMLFGDRAKLAMLLVGLGFSALLMAQQSSVFFGIMSWTYTPMVNIRSAVWVSDPLVEQVNDAQPMRDTDVTRVRSVDGVAWAAPLHTSILQARLPNGNFKLISLVGIDSDTFAGAPAVLSVGRIEDLRLPNTVLIDEWGANLLGRPETLPDGTVRQRPLGVGDTFELNDTEARIVGVCRVKRAFTGGPFVYTTYDRAKAYTAGVRRTLTVRKGIGPWTAEIYLLMVLRRPDAWPIGDLALATAAQQVKGLAQRPTPADLTALAEGWRPWRAVAARLLWHHYLSR